MVFLTYVVDISKSLRNKGFQLWIEENLQSFLFLVCLFVCLLLRALMFTEYCFVIEELGTSDPLEGASSEIIQTFVS